MLNVAAAAFVPGCSWAPQAASEGVLRQQPQLQFGSLPESLNPSPQLSGHDQQEWTQFGDSHPYEYHNGEPYNKGWQQSWEYDYGEYDSGYYGENGEWTGWWNAAEADGYYEDNPSTYYGDHHDPAAEDRRKDARNSKRNDRRKMERSWQGALVDVVASQFQFSRESVQEMLQMHEGNLEVALDMLAQLEAEMEGQLPASSQEAPELNEANYPSLGSAEGNLGSKKATAKLGFAAAVKAPPPPAACRNPPSSPVEHMAAPRTPEPSQKVPWVATGSAVSEEYATARSTARDHARVRNAYFQEATKAYLAGNKALAKELGGKGRAQSELMKAAHVAAAQAIYKHRNPSSGRGNEKRPRQLDLHGLHVKEAIATLEQEVDQLTRAKARGGRGAPPQKLFILVGTGHHTKGSRTPARLPAAVEEWLKASRITFSSPTPGLLQLSL